MKKEYSKKETETSVVITDGEFNYEPGRTYPGSARVDSEGNFAFHPYRKCGEETHNLQHITGDHIGDNARWDIHRSARTLKVVLTIRDYNSDPEPLRKVTTVFRNLFFKASDALGDVL